MMRLVIFILFILLLPSLPCAAEKRTNKAISRAYVAKIRILQAEGRKMELLRSSHVQADHDRCMDKMHKFQPLAEKLQKSGESLPLTAANMSFKAAANCLSLCVSCSKGLAAQHCERVEYFLDDGFKYLKEE